jgi:hypothetical protein
MRPTRAATPGATAPGGWVAMIDAATWRWRWGRIYY